MRDIRNSKKVKELSAGPDGRAFHRMIENMFRILREMFEPGRSKHTDKLNNRGKTAYGGLQRQLVRWSTAAVR